MRNKEVILAGLLGAAAVFGIFVFKKITESKSYHHEEDSVQYLFGKSNKTPYSGNEEGIELNAYL